MSDLGDDPPNPSLSPPGDDTAQELFLEAVEEENVTVRSRMSILHLTEQLARIQQQLQDAELVSHKFNNCLRISSLTLLKIDLTMTWCRKLDARV